MTHHYAQPVASFNWKDAGLRIRGLGFESLRDCEIGRWLLVVGYQHLKRTTKNQQLNCPGSPTGRRHASQKRGSVGSNPTQGTRRCGRTFLAQTPENLRQQVCPAHIEWRVWRNGSVTVFQTEGVGSSPATRTKMRSEEQGMRGEERSER